MRATDKPLPGDLVIRPEIDQSGVRSQTVFTVSHWPSTDVYAGPYQSYGYAVRKAREYALKDRARVWFMATPAGADVRDVTDDD